MNLFSNRRQLGALILPAAIMGLLHIDTSTVRADTVKATLLSSRTTRQSEAQETVLAVGGSAAYGWKDPNNDSYLKRAFQSLTDSTNVTYKYDDQTFLGGEAMKLEPSAAQAENVFSIWLQQDHPQVVVISWGLLNDVSNNTAIPAFKQAIHDEIIDSLVAGAVVLLVTPPVVEATAGGTNSAFENFVSAEHDVEESINNPNVHWLDLYSVTSEYMTSHGQMIEHYVGDGWHPNQAGHELAGQLLYKELVDTFGERPILFKQQTGSLSRINLTHARVQKKG